MSLKLYSYFRSSASYRVRIALNIKNLDYQYETVHLVNDGGEQKKPNYLKLNPMGQVPCLVDGELTLNQSMAILLYLDRKHPTPPLFPQDADRFAQTVQLCEIVNSGIQPIQNLRVMQHLDATFNCGPEGTAAWNSHWITSGLKGLEESLKNTAGKYSMGDEVTAADLFLVPQVYNAHRFHLDMANFPIIHQIEKNCLELEVFQKAAPENQPDAPQ